MSDANDKADGADTPKRGRRPKADMVNPHAAHQAELAKENRERAKNNPVTEKFYRLHGQKLILCKRKKSGSLSTTFVGSMTDPKHGPEIQAFVKKLKDEGRLDVKV